MEGRHGCESGKVRRYCESEYSEKMEVRGGCGKGYSSEVKATRSRATCVEDEVKSTGYTCIHACGILHQHHPWPHQRELGLRRRCTRSDGETRWYAAPNLTLLMLLDEGGQTHAV